MRSIITLLFFVAASFFAWDARAQGLGSIEILKKTEFISAQIAKMNAAERLAFRCPGQDSRVPIFNSFPVMFGNDEPSLCKNFPGIDHTVVSRNPVFSKSFRDSRKTYRGGDLVVVLLHVMNTAISGTSEIDTTAKNVLIDASFRGGTAGGSSISVRFKADNVKDGKLVRSVIGGPYGCLAALLPKSGAVYDFKGNRIGESRLEIGNGKHSLGNMRSGWEYSKFVTFLVAVHC